MLDRFIMLFQFSGRLRG